MLFTLQNNQLSIAVNSFGAELSSVIKDETEYIWQAEKAVWPRHAPNLFPIVGKLKNNSFQYEHKKYELPQHGFARDNEFQLIEQTHDTLVFELVTNEALLKLYPFHFSFQVIYQLLDNKVVQRYQVTNKANSVMYFSVGAHPAFNCPLHQDEAFEDYELIFPNTEKLTINVLQDGLISATTRDIILHNNKLPVTQSLFDNDALVCMNNQVKEVQLLSKKTKKGVALKSLNWPCFGIWTKKQTTNFICLEPWYGIADFSNTAQDLKHKKEIISLGAQQFFNCEFTITFL